MPGPPEEYRCSTTDPESSGDDLVELAHGSSLEPEPDTATGQAGSSGLSGLDNVVVAAPVAAATQQHDEVVALDGGPGGIRGFLS